MTSDQPNSSRITVRDLSNKLERLEEKLAQPISDMQRGMAVLTTQVTHLVQTMAQQAEATGKQAEATGKRMDDLQREHNELRNRVDEYARQSQQFTEPEIKTLLKMVAWFNQRTAFHQSMPGMVVGGAFSTLLLTVMYIGLHYAFHIG